MTTPRRAIPDHARGPIEDSRDAAMRIQATALAGAKVASYAAESDDPDAWRVVSVLLSGHAEIVKLAAHIVRLAESIEGVIQAPDVDAINLVEERARRAR